MSDTTPNLDLPFLMPNQAQKHVTLNDALIRLDALVQLRVAGQVDEPPAGPLADGTRYLVSDTPASDFAGHAGEVAALADGAWIFFSPAAGWVAWREDTAALHVFDGDAWPPVDADMVDRLGIATGADTTNRLAVASPASLFTHAGSDHRLSINRASASDTASLLFQTGYAGEAEIGLSGPAGLSLKVLDDASWVTRLSLPLDTPAVDLLGARSGVVTVANDAVVDIPAPDVAGFFAFMHIHSAFPDIRRAGIVTFDSGPSLAIYTAFLGTQAVNGGTTALDGTGGTASGVTIAVQPGTIQLQLRGAAEAADLKYFFFC